MRIYGVQVVGIGWVRSWTDFIVIGKGPDTAKVAGRSVQDARRRNYDPCAVSED